MSLERKPVGLDKMYLGGTVESWKSCFGHTKMAGKKNGSPLPISLQKKILFSKRFSTKILRCHTPERNHLSLLVALV